MWRVSVAVGLAAALVVGCDGSSGVEEPEDGAAEFSDAEVLPESADDAADDGTAQDEGDSEVVDVADVADGEDGGDATCECETAAECDDGELCNGAEQCVACRCAAGTPPGDGTACDDHDACTFGDACASGRCAGEPRDCDDGNPCTFDRCNATTGGCENPFVPRGSVCDDGDPCTASDACGFGTCRGECVASCSWWPDRDADGWGDASAAPTCAAAAPAGHANRAGDCCDAQPFVYPGQTNYFSTAYSCGSTSSWDYDCSGGAERRWNLLGECDMTLTGCRLTQEGWLGDVMPCGVAGPFITGCSMDTGVCSWGPTTSVTQMCR